MSDQGRHAAQTGTHLTPAAPPAGRRGTAPRRRESPARTSRPPGQKNAAGPAPAAKTRAPRKKRKWFGFILKIYLLILLVGTVGLQITLWVALYRSQRGMEREEAYKEAVRQAPQLAFEKWQSEQTGDYWMELWYAKSPANEMETQERVSEYLEGLFAPGACEAYKDASYTAAAPVYLLKSGEQPLARVSLTGSELDWSVSNVELLVAGDKTATITVPTSCSVLFNGKPLDDQFKQPADSLLVYEPIKSQLEGPVSWVTYTVEGLLADPEVTVTPPDRFATLQNADGAYLLTPAEDVDVSKYTENAVNFVRAFLNYYMNGYHDTWTNRSIVLKYLRDDTQAYQDVMDTYDSVSWASYYLSIDTSKTYAGDVIVWANNCFSVDVTYDADCTMMGEPVDYANATMRIYYRQTDNGYIISHFETL